MSVSLFLLVAYALRLFTYIYFSVHGHFDKNGESSECTAMPFCRITDKNCFNISFKYLDLKFKNTLKAIKKEFPISSIEVMEDCKFVRMLEDKNSPVSRHFQKYPWKSIKDMSLRNCLKGYN